jgi:hypothetical protein
MYIYEKRSDSRFASQYVAAIRSSLHFYIPASHLYKYVGVAAAR